MAVAGEVGAMDDLLKALALHGPIAIACAILVGPLIAAIAALWKRVVSMQGEQVEIAKEATAAQRDATAVLRELVNELKARRR